MNYLTAFATHLVHDDNLFRPDDGAQSVRHDQTCPLFACAFDRALDMSENKSSSETMQWVILLIILFPVELNYLNSSL